MVHRHTHNLQTLLPNKPMQWRSNMTIGSAVQGAETGTGPVESPSASTMHRLLDRTTAPTALVQLFSAQTHKKHMLNIAKHIRPERPDWGKYSTNEGSFEIKKLCETPFGGFLTTNTGSNFVVLRPTLFDVMNRIKRSTQIIFPKDAAYIVNRLNVCSGAHVIEAGTGSGGLTMALAFHVAPLGRVYSYDINAGQIQVAKRNLQEVGLDDVVQLQQRNVAEGFDVLGVDAVFLDLREPWTCLHHVRSSIVPGANVGAFVATTNQVSELVRAMEDSHGFIDIEVSEIMLRHFKPVPDRLRPTNSMIAHSGYLVFARAIHNIPSEMRASFLCTDSRRKMFYSRSQRAAAKTNSDTTMPTAEDKPSIDNSDDNTSAMDSTSDCPNNHEDD